MLKWTSSCSSDQAKVPERISEHLRETFLDRRQVVPRDDAAGLQHARVRAGGLDVEFRQPLIERHRRGEALHEVGDGLAETSRPGLVTAVVVGVHAAC